MIRNYLISAWRTIFRNSRHSLLNVLGLSIGLAVFTFIFQYVAFESSYDTHYEGDPIYRINTKRFSNNELLGDNAAAMPPLCPLLTQYIPTISAATRVYYDGDCVVSIEQQGERKVFNEPNAYFADSSFFSVFNFSPAYGKLETALTKIKQVAISASTARKYFGTENPIGKLLLVTGQRTIAYEVSAVFEDAPENSHLKPKIIFSFETYLDVVRPEWNVRENWSWNGFPTYFRSNAEPNIVRQQIAALANQTWGEQFKTRNMRFEFSVQPVESIHNSEVLGIEFEPKTSSQALSILMWIGIITLIIAWINYANMAVTEVLDKSREIGVRKTIGASKRQLITQFLVSATVVNLLAAIGATIALLVVQSYLQDWLSISFPMYSLNVVLTIAGISLLGSLLTSVYPAYIISGFSIAAVTRNASVGNISFRKILVIAQFVVVPVMIAGSYLLLTQTNHLLNRDRGITKDQVMVMKSPILAEREHTNQSTLFKQEVEQLTGVASASKIHLLPGEDVNWYSRFRLYGDASDEKIMNINVVESDFEKVLDVKLVSGRSFSSLNSDSSSILINEAAAKLWGYTPEQMLGRTFHWRFSPAIDHFDRTVIGVVKNYKQQPQSDQDLPIVFALARFTPAEFANQFLVVRFASQATINMADNIENIRVLWSKHFPNDPFSYEFLDQNFERRFQTEIQLSRIITFFSLLSIVIAGLGLYGLVSYSLLKRIKEIGVRKVLGASIPDVVRLLSTEFLLMILLSFAIAVPVIMWGAKEWLNNYELKSNPGIMLYLLPLVSTFVIGLLTVVAKTFFAAQQNPVKSLRTE